MTSEIEVPDAPEAPIVWNNPESCAWQSGWQAGYEAAIKAALFNEQINESSN